MLFCPAMERMNATDRQSLIEDIASREYTASQMSVRYGIPVPTLREFVALHTPAIEAARRRLEEPEDSATVTPTQLDDLWITNKFERLKRLEAVADSTYDSIINGAAMNPAEQAIVIREFRSYLMLAANELGQLLHRGSGDAGTGDVLSVEIAGVDMETLR